MFNVYISRSHNLTQETLQEVIEQLPIPFLLLGDLNSYHTMWGCRTRDARGRVIDEVLSAYHLNIFNIGAPTRIVYNTESAIDLSISTPRLSAYLIWSVADSPEDSVLQATNNRKIPKLSGTSRKKTGAHTKCTKSGTTWFCMETPLANILPYGGDCIKRLHPSSRNEKKIPIPYWTEKLKETRRIGDKLYQKYKRSKSIRNAILWKRAQAIHRKLLKEEKIK